MNKTYYLFRYALRYYTLYVIMLILVLNNKNPLILPCSCCLSSCLLPFKHKLAMFDWEVDFSFLFQVNWSGWKSAPLLICSWEFCCTLSDGKYWIDNNGLNEYSWFCCLDCCCCWLWSCWQIYLHRSWSCCTYGFRSWFCDWACTSFAGWGLTN